MNLMCRFVMLFFLIAPVSALAGESDIKASLSAVVRYEVSQGWSEKFSINQGDPQSVISYDLHEITVRLSGGKESRYKTASDFLTGFEARSMGAHPEKLETVLVSGMQSLLYRRAVPVSLPPPGTGGPVQSGGEEFCLVPAGETFIVLSYSYGDSIPDISYDGYKIWRKFLSDFHVLKGVKADNQAVYSSGVYYRVYEAIEYTCTKQHCTPFA